VWLLDDALERDNISRSGETRLQFVGHVIILPVTSLHHCTSFLYAAAAAAANVRLSVKHKNLAVSRRATYCTVTCRPLVYLS